MRFPQRADGGVAGLILLSAILAPPVRSQTTERVSVASDGTQGDAASAFPSISADGRFVAFASSATNLVAGDTNGFSDVFVHDRQTGVTERVSVASDGTQGNAVSNVSAISADGRFVAFASDANNLVAGDINGATDVFVRDRQTGVTERVNVASDGTEGNGTSAVLAIGVSAISADGRFVAFASDADNLVAGDTNTAPDVFVRDRQTGATERVSVTSDGTQGNGASGGPATGLLAIGVPAISADGRFVVFPSNATNLVAGDTNGSTDVFVRDRQTGVTERVSVASDGTQGNLASGVPAISADGRFVAFVSNAIIVAGDTNGATDVFVRDRQTGVTERVSVASDGSQGNGASGSSLVGVPAISAGDGRFVGFASNASNLVTDTNGATDVFLHDRQTGATERVSVASDGTQGNGMSGFPAISADGRFVAFASNADNLVTSDTNGAFDVFVRTTPPSTTTTTTPPARCAGQPISHAPQCDLGPMNGAQLDSCCTEDCQLRLEPHTCHLYQGEPCLKDPVCSDTLRSGPDAGECPAPSFTGVTEVCEDGDACTFGDHCDGAGHCASGSAFCGARIEAFKAGGLPRIVLDCFGKPAAGGLAHCKAGTFVALVAEVDGSPRPEGRRSGELHCPGSSTAQALSSTGAANHKGVPLRLTDGSGLKFNRIVLKLTPCLKKLYRELQPGQSLKVTGHLTTTGVKRSDQDPAPQSIPILCVIELAKGQNPTGTCRGVLGAP